MQMDADGAAVPALAETYDISEDGKTYTFHLRDAKWSNGDAVTAADFVFGWQRAVDPANASEYSYMLSDIGQVVNAAQIIAGEKPVTDLGVTAVDDKTLEVQLNVPVSYFLSLMYFPTFYPMNQKFFESCGDTYGTSADTVLSNGAFVLTSYEPAATAFELVKNADKYVPYVTPASEYFHYGQHETVVDDGLPAGFGTESRKIEVYCQILLKLARTGYPFCYPEPQEPCEDYSPICSYIEPAESPLSDEEYPFVLTSGRVPYFHHGTMRHAALSRELFPTAEIRINPASAKELGIEHMDWVKVTSRRGEVHARAYLTEGVHPKTVWMERFWNPECYDESQTNPTAGWRECNVNVLTKNDAPFNEVYGSYTNRGFTVKIEKSQKPANVWVEPEEFAPFLPTEEMLSEAQTKDVF